MLRTQSVNFVDLASLRQTKIGISRPKRNKGFIAAWTNPIWI